MLRAFEGFAQRAVVLVKTNPAMLRAEFRQQPLLIIGQLFSVAGELIAPCDATPGLHGAGLCHVGHIHHQPRRHLEGVEPRIRLLNHFPGNAQRGVANVNRIAGFQVQQRHQPWRQQHAARLGLQPRRLRLESAIQRIAVIHRLDVRQLRRIARKGHGGEAQLFADAQP